MTAAEAILLVLATPVLTASGYLVLLTLLSWRARPPLPGAPELRFDIVVPAHDEEPGIAATVASLQALDYPPELRRVVVVADNCTDATAARARDAGAHVLVRDNPTLRGKGYALAYAFEHLLVEGAADALVVVDADTLVSTNLLRAFAVRLDAGASVLQADYTVRNADASWRTRLMAIALAAIHALRSLARERLGLSCGLKGNGMCFTPAVLAAVPHDAFSVVEDLEYGIRLGRAGHRVHYVAEAHVYGEMPSGEHNSRTQRRRWEAGRTQMVRLHALPLLARGLRTRDRVLLDLAMDLLVPPLATVVVLTLVGLGASLALSWWAGHLLWVTWTWIGCLLGVCAYVLRGWQLSGTGASGLLGLCFAPAYVVWKLVLMLRRSPQARGEWVRTAREGGEAP